MKHGTTYAYGIKKCRCDLCRNNWNDYCRPRNNLVIQQRKTERDEAKAAPCMDCGNTFPPECMDWDHRPGETKLFHVTQNLGTSKEKIDAEMAKCDLVCSNCHRIRTKKRANEK